MTTITNNKKDGRFTAVYDYVECIICGAKELTKVSTKRGKNKILCVNKKCLKKYNELYPPQFEKVCACGKLFVAKRKNAKYCSEKCMKFRYINICVICGKEFNSNKSGNAVKTCSHECRWELNRSKMVTLECIHCDTEFERPSFTVREGNVFCSTSCGNSYFAQENYGTFNRYGENWYFIRKEVLEYYEYICQRCNIKYDVHMHVHHCVPFKYFDSYKEANIFNNLIPLCHECHVETHEENKEWYKKHFRQK